MDRVLPFPLRDEVRARGPSVRFDWDVAKALCQKLAIGMSERAVERLPGMPSRRAIRDWALREPEFSRWVDEAKAYARRARQAKSRVANEERRWRQLLRGGPPRSAGRSLYTPELAETICARIALGESVLAVGNDPTMPCTVTLYNWMRTNDTFNEMYVRAKAVSAQTMFDLAYEVALETTEETVRADRVRLQTLRWRTALLAPKVYGERQVLGPPVLADPEDKKKHLTVIVQNFCDPPEGSQFVDLEGNEVPRPEGHETGQAEEGYWARQYQRVAAELAQMRQLAAPT